MTVPTLLFGMLLASLYGALFHLWRNGGLGRLFLYVALSWVGFWSGHVIAGVLEWTFWSVGSLRAGPATLGSVVFLIVGYWLSLVQVDRR